MRSAKDAEAAFAYFDSLSPVSLEECTGRWRGSTFPSGHPLDGVLEGYGWYGKEIIDADHVHPLLFERGDGDLACVDPAPLPTGVLAKVPALFRSKVASAAFRAVRPLLHTSAPKAKLRLVEHRGVTTAAMIYNDKPIVDTFRKVDADTLLGVMDLRGMRQPYFFLLERDPKSAARYDRA